MDFDYNYAVQIIVIFVIIIILFALLVRYSRKKETLRSSQNKVEQFNSKRKREKFEDMDEKPFDSLPKITQPTKATDDVKGVVANMEPVKPSEPINNEDFQAVDFDTENSMPSDCYPTDRLTTDDLLPKDAANSEWAQSNPAGQGSVDDISYLTAGHHIGVNTIGNTLRNANMQLRSDPPIEKINGLSPWGNTTIEYDSNRKPFEIGMT